MINDTGDKDLLLAQWKLELGTGTVIREGEGKFGKWMPLGSVTGWGVCALPLGAWAALLQAWGRLRISTQFSEVLI